MQAVSFPVKAGILFFPFVTMEIRSVSDSFSTSGEFKARAFSILPAGVVADPSALWHIWHFDV